MESKWVPLNDQNYAVDEVPESELPGVVGVGAGDADDGSLVGAGAGAGSLDGDGVSLDDGSLFLPFSVPLSFLSCCSWDSTFFLVHYRRTRKGSKRDREGGMG